MEKSNPDISKAKAIPLQTSVCQWTKNGKNSAIRNCWIIARGAIKLLPISTCAKRSMCAEEVQFYCPSSTYPAILLLVLYFITFNYSAIFEASTDLSEAHVLKRCIKNCSIVKLYNKVLIPNSKYCKLKKYFIFYF